MNNLEDNKPLVSVILTAYNRADYITVAIESALAQDYENLEIIVSDNCSTDGTSELIQKYVTDNRVKYYRNDYNIGMIPNFKLATSRAEGEYLTYISSDDYFIEKSFVSESINLINKYPDVLLVLGQFRILNEDTTKIDTDRKPIYHKEFIKGKELFIKSSGMKTLTWAGAVMHLQTFKTLRPFESEATSIDVMSNLKLMLLGNVAFISKPVYMQRVHENSASLKIEIEQAINNFIYITEPYHMALKNNIIPELELDKWKCESSFIYARYTSIKLAPFKDNYKRFMNYFKINFPCGFKKLRTDPKWNILAFFFKRPSFSLKILKLLSKNHYLYLKMLVENGKDTLSERLKL